MDITIWLSYVAMISALIAFPGPSSLLITLHGYQHGLAKTNYTITANLLGSLVLMILSALGLGIIISTSDVLFTLIKYCGAAYLIYIGIKTWNKPTKTMKANNSTIIETASAMFKQGFFTGISNPKDLVFFAALFPVFIDQTQAITAQLVILMSTWLVVDYVIKLMYASMGKRINQWFTGGSIAKIFNRITGGMFIFAGLALAGSHNK